MSNITLKKIGTSTIAKIGENGNFLGYHCICNLRNCFFTGQEAHVNLIKMF